MKSASKNNVFLVIAKGGDRIKDEEDPEKLEESGLILGKVVIELFDDATPRTAKNFRSIASQEKGKGKSGVKMTYNKCILHRVVDDKLIQGGDFVKGKRPCFCVPVHVFCLIFHVPEGTGAYGESIYGGSFKDEPKGLKKVFDCEGLIAMANGGKNSNTSQFFFTLSPLPDLNGKHVIFGRVVEGMEVLKKINDIHKEFGDKEGWKENEYCYIHGCGVL